MALKPSPGKRGDPVWLPEVLRAFGVTVIEDKNWKLWGMGDFSTIWGVIAHHTGANNTSASYIRYNPGISNALSSQIHLSRDGVATLVGAGIAWHAGRGEYPGIATNNANAVTIGIEAQGDGQTWPAVEMEAYYRVCAAICWYLGLPASRVIAHHEWAGRAQGKWDPGLNGRPMPMGPFRAKVNELIDRFNKHGTLDPVSLEGLFMSLPKERQEDLARKIDTIHELLTGVDKSRSAYAVNDAKFSIPFLVREMDGRIHEDAVLNAAERTGLTPEQVVEQLREGKNFAQIEGGK